MPHPQLLINFQPGRTPGYPRTDEKVQQKDKTRYNRSCLDCDEKRSGAFCSLPETDLKNERLTGNYQNSKEITGPGQACMAFRRRI